MSEGLSFVDFFGKLHLCYSLESEMCGIYRGLTIVLEKELNEIIIIETYLTTAEELLREGPPQNYPFRSIVVDSRYLIRRCNYSIRHIMRKCN
ncbi:hypothetical protein ACSBR2_017125 [Camellia fascicularis]